jgi:hypothetical protein
MQLTFIKPTLGYLGEGDRFVDEGRMEPLALGVLAGLTLPDVDCHMFDARIDEIDYDEPTDLLAFHVETFTACVPQRDRRRRPGAINLPTG